MRRGGCNNGAIVQRCPDIYVSSIPTLLGIHQRCAAYKGESESRPTDGQKNKHTKNSHYHTQREHRREGKKYCFRTHPSKAICTLSKASCNHSDLPCFTHSELCKKGNKLGCGRHPYRDEALLPKHCCLLRTLGGKGPVRHNLKLLV